ncbi:MAG: Rpn family recombination-promoting nuclease/putative transposase [Spirochaetales bacterium]|nr:Rpn family recombination-promoting nuclease/putative transposase [Spirochaetales bacterium]
MSRRKGKNQLSAEERRLIIRNMTPMHNPLMQLLFNENVRLVEELLNGVLGRSDFRVITVETEKKFPALLLQKSVQLDVLATLDDGSKVNIEIQIKEAGADPFRSRFYHSIMDTNHLRRGESYNDLPCTYVIFITEKDIFGLGERIYTFTDLDIRLNLPLNNGQYTIYVNRCAEYDGSRLADILHDFGCCNPDDMRVDYIRREVNFYKNTEEGNKVINMMSNSFYAAGMKKGEAKGEAKGRAEGEIIGRVREKIKYIGKGFETVSEAAMDIGISENEFRRIASENGFTIL